MIDGYMVFWVHSDENGLPVSDCEYFLPLQMNEAMEYMADVRKNPDNQFVGFVSQNSSSIGKAGVDSVRDGFLPSGEKYDWSKAGRAGRMRKSDKIVEKVE